MHIDIDSDRTMLGTARGVRVRRPWLQLLSAVLQLAGKEAELLRHSERPWSTVTFSGTRHTIAISFTGAEAIASGEAFIAALPEHEFDIPGQLVADATISTVEHDTLPEPRLTVETELLLLEDF